MQIAIRPGEVNPRYARRGVGAETSPPGPLGQSYQLSAVSCQLKTKCKTQIAIRPGEVNSRYARHDVGAETSPPGPLSCEERGRVGDMAWRYRFADLHAIMWATTARDLSPRPPLLKERGRVGGMDWRCQLADMSTPLCGQRNGGAGPLPPAPSPKGKGEES